MSAGRKDDSATLVKMLTHSSRRSRVCAVPHGYRRTDNGVKVLLMCSESSVASEGILVPDPCWKMQTNSYTTQMPVQQKGFAVHSRDKQVKTPNTGDTVLGKDVELDPSENQ